ncbi:MAG: hypothetical protein CL912_08260 [Deltaproteobacteria bacterium]|nr:hypothetical protein [Deltaproteobacteria bacterium]
MSRIPCRNAKKVIESYPEETEEICPASRLLDKVKRSARVWFAGHITCFRQYLRDGDLASEDDISLYIEGLVIPEEEGARGTEDECESSEL